MTAARDRQLIESLRAASGHARRATEALRAVAECWRDIAAARRALVARWREDHGRGGPAQIDDDDLAGGCTATPDADPAAAFGVSGRVTPERPG